jgi:polyisoprenoid-binding protein YceI
MTTRYPLDPSKSLFTVQAFAAGMLSMFAHSPLFTVRDFTGVISFDGDAIQSLRVEVGVNAGTLELKGNYNAVERTEIEGRMRQEVLETASFPQVTLQAGAVSAERLSPGHHRLRIDGSLSLHGVTRPLQVNADLRVYEDGIRLTGEFPLRLSDFRIKPVTALGGAIKLKDELKLALDFAAVPEAS